MPPSASAPRYPPYNASHPYNEYPQQYAPAGYPDPRYQDTPQSSIQGNYAPYDAYEPVGANNRAFPENASHPYYTNERPVFDPALQYGSGQYPYQSTSDARPSPSPAYAASPSKRPYQPVSTIPIASPSHPYQYQAQAQLSPYPVQVPSQSSSRNAWPSNQPYPHTLPSDHAAPVNTIVNPAPQATIPSATPSIKIRFTAPPQASSEPVMASGRSSRRASHTAQDSSALEPQIASSTGRLQRGSSRRAAVQVTYKEEEDEDEFDEALDEDANGEIDEDAFGEEEMPVPTTRSGRHHKAPVRLEEEYGQPAESASPEYGRRSSRTRGKRKIILDPDEDDEDEEVRPPPRNAFPPRATRNSLGGATVVEQPVQVVNGVSLRATRSSARAATRRHSSADGEDFEPEGDSPDDDASSDALGNYEDPDDPDEDDFVEDDDGEGYGSKRRSSSRRRPAARSTRATTIPTRRSTRSAAKARVITTDEDSPQKGRSLRARTSKVNYHIPTMEDISKEISMQEAIAAASRPGGRVGAGGGLRGMGVKFGLPFNLGGKGISQAMGDLDSSDSDDMEFASPLKSGAAGASIPGGGTAVAARGAGGPSDVPNFGRINPKSSTADADPLGVDMNVTFDNVGGLDNHINQLKEMVALPLLYPEVFQQFGITPPRGVLFHGPPGTGKTLLARALAASCSNGNTKISFFMRKGADVLSKWVGEAERQLRMLFEEARASQPSIIFFDEIDGLAPVRSSKQDQIHASLVSTLLALMDGMDGRGQVIVIGATNRPDAVDPALRRPGRFDREFYFPLPNREARKKIIGINTRKWTPPLSDDMLDRLAGMTKGYGGADLRALSTEAALNAIQRRYPQIYKTADRLELKLGTIKVQAKDFMMSVKKIVPSSARSTASPAIPLPAHLHSLLSSPLERLKDAVDHVLPPKKHATALEEAEYEEEDEDNFEKHMMVQALSKLRTFRPRVLVHGQPGMGQTYLGPALLNHLEGYHVQSLDLGTLMGDSTRSVENAIVQLFVEAKRHQPSVIFIPSISQWSQTIPELARSTFGALLNDIPPSDPILLLALADGSVDDLPGDVRAWFGFATENKIQLGLPTPAERKAYFADLVESVRRPPTDFPDGVPRKKRVFEVLPLAKPLPPRQPTEAEKAREEEKDQAARNMMVVSFTNLVQEFMKRYRKVAASVREDAMTYSRFLAEQAALAAAPVDGTATAPVDVDAAAPIDEQDAQPRVNGNHMEVDPVPAEADPTAIPSTQDSALLAPPSLVPTARSTPAPEAVPAPVPAPPAAPTWQAHNIDVDTIQRRLVRHKYFQPSDFLADIAKIEENAFTLNDPERHAKMVEMGANARLHVSGFDSKWTPEFERYAERMQEKKRERQRRKEGLEKAQAKEKEVESEVQGETGEAGPPEIESSSSKRPREGDDESNGREKRPRDDEPIIGEASTSSQPAVEPSTTTAQVPESFPRAPTPPPSYPPFTVSSHALDLLQSELEAETNFLSIDQLEQLRATLFDKVWVDRKEWDRTETVEKMRKRLAEYVREVERWRERGGWGE
ncbi:hypothetical protein I350_02156 [Cryptococcus amylolentus CBS 6273]|uniref:AAA+ ATPase domain-containing protein n=1 Tax=Cryptococcus amylolentus CBS 6273 TaxID=1296118 RepID=A0A1E3KAQ7_9TREE|nr:hypothetical protein I350_02156 [Cryptococcus amylolentus CBS 6273]